MNTKKLLVSTCFAALAYLSGCGIQVWGDVQAGRNALQTGRPHDAVSYFLRAAKLTLHIESPIALA